jgi:septum site-determining protein MinC
MSDDRIIIKGTSDGLIITLGAGGWSGLMEELDRRLGEKASFFKGGRVALRVGLRQLLASELEVAGQVLNRHQVTLWAVDSDSVDTKAAAAELGLETGLATERQAGVPSQGPAAKGDSLVVQRTLRSGQVIYHPGHVVIIGDVNPGAEVRAGGSVVIWGRLRGTIHAGMNDQLKDTAVVCALQLTPTQLRIGDYIARSPAETDPHDVVPEMAFVQDGRIVAEAWKRGNG